MVSDQPSATGLASSSGVLLYRNALTLTRAAHGLHAASQNCSEAIKKYELTITQSTLLRSRGLLLKSFGVYFLSPELICAIKRA